MSYLSYPNPYLQPSGRISQGAPGYRSNRWRKIRPGPIYNLDDDSLLHVFYLCRLVCLECDDDKAYISERISGGGGWAREHWWCTLVRVCRKWRRLIFGSPSHLRLCIVYTNGTPVADMLTHQPFVELRLPLVIDYIHRGPDRCIPPEHEWEIIQVLQHCTRVRRIRLHAPFSRAVFRALDGEFPILECLYLKIPNAPCWNWAPPRTLRIPRLGQLVLNNIICPLQSPFLTPAADLVTLSLTDIDEPGRFSPNDLLQRLTLMPRLETLRIGFALFSSSPAGEMQIRTHVELRYLRRFLFNGTSTYLGAFLPYISTPPLEKLQIYIGNWMTSSIPYILQLMSRSENFTSYSVDLVFLDKGVFVRANLSDGARWTTWSMSLHGDDFTWQVLSAAQFFYIHRACFSATKYLTIHCRTPASKQPHLGPNLAQWRTLFRVFYKVHSLVVYDGSHAEISRCFQINHGESANELFPSLKQLTIHTHTNYYGAWAPFVNARQQARNPVHAVYLGGKPSAISMAMSCEAWEAPWLWGSFRLRLN